MLFFYIKKICPTKHTLNKNKDDKKGGVDRSSTVIAKDPEGKKFTPF